VLFEHGLSGKPASTFPDHARILFLSMILSENRFPLFRIMLGSFSEYDLFGNRFHFSGSGFASFFEHNPLGNPILIFPNHALSLSMVFSATGIHFRIMLL
jgi:hypothetical protein